jgi:hypothetical protein
MRETRRVRAMTDDAPIPHSSSAPAVSKEGQYVARLERNFYRTTSDACVCPKP